MDAHAGIRDRATFEALRGSRARGRCGVVAVTYVPAPPGGSARVAFAVARRVGGAVTRNRIRRRLRAILRQLPLEAGAYLVSAGPDAATIGFDELRSQVGAAVQRAVGQGAPA